MRYTANEVSFLVSVFEMYCKVFKKKSNNYLRITVVRVIQNLKKNC